MNATVADNSGMRVPTPVARGIERTVATVVALFWAMVWIPNLFSPVSQWACLALAAVLVTLIWVRHTRWRGLGLFAWALLAYLSACDVVGVL